MEKVILTKVYSSNKDKNGNELVNRNGKPYTRMSIKTQQHGDTWLSGFQNRTNENWKQGDEVEIIVTQNGQYTNFETPKTEDMLAMRVKDLEIRVDRLEEKLNQGTKAPMTYTEKDLQPDDEQQLPF